MSSLELSSIGLFALWVIFIFVNGWGMFSNLLNLYNLLALGCCSLLLYHCSVVWGKVLLPANVLLYMVFCKDKKWKPHPDPGAASKEAFASADTRTLVFVRHGESTWNDTFNAGERSKIQFILGFIPGLIKAFGYEVYLLLTGRTDSWFFDSPLSHHGLNQVKDLAQFLEGGKHSGRDKEIMAILNAEPGAPKSLLLTSNLRRALSTVVAGFRARLKRNPQEKIVMLSSLQEISRNPDTLSLTPAETQPEPSWLEKESQVADFAQVYEKQVDVSSYTGQKALNTNGLKRMLAFCDWAFEEDRGVLIIGGHSLWFREFFRTFIPRNERHTAKDKKLVNGGCVKLTLQRGKDGGAIVYKVDPKSISTLYGGFAK